MTRDTPPKPTASPETPESTMSKPASPPNPSAVVDPTSDDALEDMLSPEELAALEADPMAWMGLPDDAAPAQSPLAAQDAVRASVHADIRADLEATQGPWRQKGWLGRAWPELLAIGFALVFVFVRSPAAIGVWGVASVWAIAFALLLGLAGVAIAPAKPALGERFGQATWGLVLTGGALQLVQATHMTIGPLVPKAALMCTAMTFVGASVPLGMMVWGLKRSGLPVRSWHSAAVAAAAMAAGSWSSWRHCQAHEMWHVIISHVAVPSLSAAAAVWLVARAMRRRSEALSAAS